MTTTELLKRRVTWWDRLRCWLFGHHSGEDGPEACWSCGTEPLRCVRCERRSHAASTFYRHRKSDVPGRPLLHPPTLCRDREACTRAARGEE